MSSATTVSAYEQACARQRWMVPDPYNIVTHTFASSYITGPVRAVSSGREL